MTEEIKNNADKNASGQKVPIELFIESNTPKFEKTSFISTYNGSYDSNINDKGDKIRLIQINDYVAKVSIDFDKKQYTVIPKLAGTVLSSSIISTAFNNRTNQAPIESYEVKIKKAINGKTIISKFNNDDIANDRLFAAKLGVLSTLSFDENKEFVSKLILKNNPDYISQFKNAGRINFDNMVWLWSNAMYFNKKVYSQNKEGNIDIGIGTYYRVDKSSRKILPTYIPNKKSVSDILAELFANIFEAWDGAIEPYLALGFMVLSCYCPEFWKKEGFGVLAFVGDTEAGKTEITALGLGLYGYDKSFMTSTRCTLVGLEQKMHSVNCTPIIIDDLSRLRLTGDGFIEEMKRITHGLTRDKGLNGQESGALPPCSTFVFSSNYLPCEKGEVLNRLLYLNSDNLKFYPQKYKYFGKAVNKLSCILPYVLDIGFSEIEKIHTEAKQLLLDKFPNGSDRMFSQIAIAITGLKVFQKIAGEKHLKMPVREKMPEYIIKCIKRFETAKNPIEKLLDALPGLLWKGYIKKEEQVEILQKNGMTIVRLYKTLICIEYNRYIAQEPSEKIKSESIKEENGENFTILKFNKPEKIGGKNRHVIELDITDYPLTPTILEAYNSSGY